MTQIQTISSGGYIVTDASGRTTYCADLNAVITLLQSFKVI